MQLIQKQGFSQNRFQSPMAAQQPCRKHGSIKIFSEILSRYFVYLLKFHTFVKPKITGSSSLVNSIRFGVSFSAQFSRLDPIFGLTFTEKFKSQKQKSLGSDKIGFAPFCFRNKISPSAVPSERQRYFKEHIKRLTLIATEETSFSNFTVI